MLIRKERNNKDKKSEIKYRFFRKIHQIAHKAYF